MKPMPHAEAAERRGAARSMARMMCQLKALAQGGAASLRLSRFPRQVWIENTNACNARCIMCPREKHTRPIGFMEFPLFEKIIREVAGHRDEVEKVNFHNYGEPLLDRLLPARIRMAKELGIRQTYFVTNASLLKPAVAEALIDAGLDHFKVSFYGTAPESYEQTMRGLRFQETIDNIRSFLAIREKKGSRTPSLVVQFLPQETNAEERDGFVTLFESLIDKQRGDCLSVFKLHNFGDGRAYSSIGGTKPSRVCFYPWKTMVILYDGSVVPCCMDYNGVQVLGDVKTQSLEEIWRGSFSALRRRFTLLRYDGLPVCRLCDINRGEDRP